MKLVPEIQDVSLYMQHRIATCTRVRRRVHIHIHTHTHTHRVYIGSYGVWRFAGGEECRMEPEKVHTGLDKDEGVVAT